MAVIPREAAKINDVAERKAVKEMEEHIDGILNKDFRTGTTVRIPANDIRKAGGPGYSERGRDEVLAKFKAAGWIIKKKRTQENYGGASHGYAFSEDTSHDADLYKCHAPTAPTPTMFDADNEGLPPESQR